MAGVNGGWRAEGLVKEKVLVLELEEIDRLADAHRLADLEQAPASQSNHELVMSPQVRTIASRISSRHLRQSLSSLWVRNEWFMSHRIRMTREEHAADEAHEWPLPRASEEPLSEHGMTLMKLMSGRYHGQVRSPLVSMG